MRKRTPPSPSGARSPRPSRLWSVAAATLVLLVALGGPGLADGAGTCEGPQLLETFDATGDPYATLVIHWTSDTVQGYATPPGDTLGATGSEVTYTAEVGGLSVDLYCNSGTSGAFSYTSSLTPYTPASPAPFGPAACADDVPCYFDNTAGFAALADLVHGLAAYTVVVSCLVVFFLVINTALLFVLGRQVMARR